MDKTSHWHYNIYTLFSWENLELVIWKMKEVTNACCCFLCRNQTPWSWVLLAVCYFNNAKSNISKVSNVIVDGYGWFKWKMSHVELLSCNTNYSVCLDNTWAIIGSTEESQTWRKNKTTVTDEQLRTFSCILFHLVPLSWTVEYIFPSLYNHQSRLNYSWPWLGQLQKLSIPACEVKVYIWK